MQETASVRPDPETPPETVSLEFNYKSLALTLYLVEVFFGTLMLGHLGATDGAAWEIGALVAILINFALFFLVVPKDWNSDIRFSAFILLVGCPTAYIVASFMGMVRLFA